MKHGNIFQPVTAAVVETAEASTATRVFVQLLSKTDETKTYSGTEAYKRGKHT